ncbi:dTDP-4-dehydrorhamnose reductase [Kineococcus indalonis]|uniref:dTDP-4-dehydrorhamnose reductase n=1 Tax=Kineococcus indalonis TaxID=2696566 RepID=UPI0014123333|nr:dTDP-4-dehydrorhamnose reductase [Kineococcus indalonis]NAZ85244.1 dTDP-4-dehydrorhamnose reductase [Kineococcus indalonis]
MRWVVTGATGMLGVDVVDVLRAAGEDVSALGRADLDVTAAQECRRAVDGADVVVNCAAHTAVDAAETEEGAAFAVNAVGARNLAVAAAAAGARLVHVSTDYVFDGTATEPYPVHALPDPRGAYGRTKAAGEWAVAASGADALVLRTAWLYGAHGACFPRTIARAGAERGALSVVDDQVGQPTWSRDVARLALDLVAAGAPAGTYHAVSAGRCSWHQFAAAVLASAGLERVALEPVTSAQFVRPAPRPAFSVLDTSQLAAAGVEPIGPWRERWELAAPSVLG